MVNKNNIKIKSSTIKMLLSIITLFKRKGMKIKCTMNRKNFIQNPIKLKNTLKIRKIS